MSSAIERVGVIGAGQMGGGIAEVCARAGVDVTVFETTEALVTAGRNRIAKSLERGVSAGKITERERDGALERLRFTTTDGKPADPPDPDAPAWMLTAEEYAGADEKTKALFDALLESQEALTAQKPAEDPYAKDPFIAWRREALARGETAIPTAPSLEELGGVELLREVDAAFQQEDPKVWIKAMQNLVATVSTEAVARSNVQHQMAIQDAYQNGAKSAELRGELVNFVRSVPDFKDANEPIVVRGPEGNYILNENHPAKDFAVWIKEQVAAGTLTDAFVMKHGYGPVWTTYQSDKAGGYNKMQAMNRQRISKDVVTRMREVRTGSLSRAAAPSVGSIPTGNSRPETTFHGFTKGQLSTEAGIKAALDTWDRSGNKEAMNGVLPFLQGQAQVLATRQ